MDAALLSHRCLDLQNSIEAVLIVIGTGSFSFGLVSRVEARGDAEVTLKTSFVFGLVVGVAGMSIAGTALAVGDPPTKLDRRQATALYASIKPLLTNDGATCPKGQVPVSGQIVGGASPGGGSRTMSITFNRGAVVKIVRQWTRGLDGAATTSATITCS